MRQGALRTIIALAIAGCAASPGIAQWKWKDADGTVTYSDQPPPPSIPSTRIRIERTVPAPSSAGEPGRRSTEDLDAEFRQRQADREAALRQEETRRQAEEARARACEGARERLRTLESGRRIAELDGAGERRVVTEETREERIRTLTQQLRERCAEAAVR
jgi:hypothetical protein